MKTTFKHFVSRCGNMTNFDQCDVHENYIYYFQTCLEKILP